MKRALIGRHVSDGWNVDIRRFQMDRDGTDSRTDATDDINNPTDDERLVETSRIRRSTVAITTTSAIDATDATDPTDPTYTLCTNRSSSDK